MNGSTIDRESLVALAVDAARSGDTDTLTPAIAAGVSVNATSPRGDSLLMLACYYGHTTAVGALIDRGADVNQPDAGGRRRSQASRSKGCSTWRTCSSPRARRSTPHRPTAAPR
jgi:hypothetical protein